MSLKWLYRKVLSKLPITFKAVDVLHQAEAVAFLRALREVGSLHLERLDNHAFVLRFEAVASLEQLRSSFFFKSNISLEKLFEKYGIDLFRLLQEEAG